MFDQNTTIDDFLRATAARQPTPGGGSVSALVGALACAIGEMVLNYSIGKKGLEIYREDLDLALHELHTGRDMMLLLMVEDQNAYASVSALRKQPSSPERDKKYAEALEASIATPQSMAATAFTLLGTCQRIVDLVNWHLLSDLAVCAELAMATGRCAIYNVRVNLSELQDKEKSQKIEADLQQMLARGVESIQRIIPEIWLRISQGE
jgi:formiminotetrahydrofolate cyclodeaminase